MPSARPIDDVLHPRGRIAPLLPVGAPLLRRFGRGLVRLGQGLVYHDAFRAAPAMAFHFFLSLLPLLVFIGYVVGLVAQSTGENAVVGIVLDSLPVMSEAVLKAEVTRLATADRLGPLAAIGFIWIASGGMHGLMDAVEMVVGAPRRAWWKQRLHATAWVLATLVFVGVASFGIIEWEAVVHTAPSPDASGVVVQQAAREAEHEIEQAVHEAQASHIVRPVAHRTRRLLRAGGERMLTAGFSLVTAVGGLAAFYRFSVTHPRRVRRRLVPGAVLAVVLWLVVSWGFSLYIRSLVNYTVYYGSLTAVAVLLVWLWLMSLAILVGAELNAQLEGLRDLHELDELRD